jgi:thermitase
MLGRWSRWAALGLVVAVLVASAPLSSDSVAAETDPVQRSGGGHSNGDSGRTQTVTIKARGQNVQTSTFEVESAPNGEPMRAGGLLVKFRSNTSDDARDNVHRSVGTYQVQGAPQANVARVTVASGDADRSLAAYRAHGEVEWAQPDYIRHTTAIPNDPNFGDQWGLSKIRAPDAWNTTHGSNGVKLAILDCGIYTESSNYVSPDGKTGHPDLRGKVVAEQDFTGSQYGPDDLCDHGTHVAGIAAALTNNGIGGAGIGYDTALLNGKVLDDTGSGSDEDIAAGIDWAVANGARVISMSLGGGGTCDDSPVVKTAIGKAWAAGVVVVAAAGNSSGNSSMFPGNCPNVVAVAATDSNDARASFSNYGSNVDIAAPGVDILSSDYLGNYIKMSGTSMATPFVSGLMALVWSTSYGTGAQAVIDRVLSTAASRQSNDQLGSVKRIDAAAAVELSSGSQPTSTPGPTVTPGPTAQPTASPTASPTPVVLQPNVSLALSAAPNPIKLRSKLTYTAIVTNNGNKSGTNVKLIDKLPNSLDYVSASTTRGSCKRSSSTITCTIGTLAINQSATIRIVVKPNKVSTVSNTASVTLNETDASLANNEGSVAVTVTK